MQCSTLMHTLTSLRSTLEKKLNLLLLKLKKKKKKNRKQTNDITVYIVNGITFHKKQLIIFHAYFTTSTKQKHINITDK